MQIQKIILISLFSFFLAQVLQSQCKEETYSTNAKDSWLSCQATTIPNSFETVNYHWIYYDLGYEYHLGTIKIWNYNVANDTGKGIKDGEVFYSTDGENWETVGVFQIPEASGQNNYQGWEGIDLKGVNARFLTIAAYSNWENGDCMGISEVRFNISEQTTSFAKIDLPNSELLIFPNPTKQTLSLSLKSNEPIQELVILNNAGHEVLRRIQPNATTSIDVASFPAGMYSLQLLTVGKEVITRRFIKGR